MGIVQACASITEPPPNAAEQRLRAGSLPQAVPPVPTDGLLGVAQDHYQAGNYGYAARYFEQAAAVGQGPEAWLGLAAAYDRLRRFDMADSAYERVRDQAGSSAAYHNNLGYSYLLRGWPGRARTEFQTALALAPGDPVIRNNLVLLDRAGQAAAAGIATRLAREK